MHDLLKASALILAATALTWGAGAVHAQADLKAPSFDCQKASEPDEETICTNFSIAWLDRQLGRAWKRALERAGGEGGADLQAAQVGWLAERRACEKDDSCLLDAYVARLQMLTSTGSEHPNLGGSYGYSIGENYSGSLSLVHFADDTLAGAIATVSGPSYHLCNVHFEDARKIGDFYLWNGPANETGIEGRQCKVLIQPADDGSIKIDSQDCSYYCGARGRFDAEYLPPGKG